jgi:hypothetical protein
VNDEGLKPLGRRRLLIVGGMGTIALAAVGLGSLRHRGEIAQNTPGLGGVSPDAKMTALSFIGALFGRELSELDIADLSDRLDYLLSSSAPFNHECAVLAHYLDGLARERHATTFRASSAAQKQSIVDELMRIDSKSIISRALSRLSASKRDHYRMRWSIVPQLEWIYRNSGAAWRARGYTRWPGIPGDWHDVLTPGPPYP